MTSQPAASDQALCGAPLTSGRLTTADAVELAKVLAALADPVRLQLVSLVAADREGLAPLDTAPTAPAVLALMSVADRVLALAPA